MALVMMAVVPVAAAAAASSSGAACGGGGERLSNGLCLPADWPPRLARHTHFPASPWYLLAPPAAIPIDAGSGRHLFVDPYLVDAASGRWHPAAPRPRSSALSMTAFRPAAVRTWYPGKFRSTGTLPLRQSPTSPRNGRLGRSSCPTCRGRARRTGGSQVENSRGRRLHVVHSHSPGSGFSTSPVTGFAGPKLLASASPYSGGVFFDPADQLYKMWCRRPIATAAPTTVPLHPPAATVLFRILLSKFGAHAC